MSKRLLVFVLFLLLFIVTVLAAAIAQNQEVQKKEETPDSSGLDAYNNWLATKDAVEAQWNLKIAAFAEHETKVLALCEQEVPSSAPRVRSKILPWLAGEYGHGQFEFDTLSWLGERAAAPADSQITVAMIWVDYDETVLSYNLTICLTSWPEGTVEGVGSLVVPLPESAEGWGLLEFSTWGYSQWTEETANWLRGLPHD